MNRFDTQHLPKFVPNTFGIAYPRPGGTVVACRVPITTTVPAWGAERYIDPTYWHVALATDDMYPNNEFDLFYEVGRKVTAEEDPRAAALITLWKEKGYDVEVFEAEKTKPTFVVGVLDEEGEFLTNEGWKTFQRGDILLKSIVNDQMYPIKPETFLKRYDDQGIRRVE